MNTLISSTMSFVLDFLASEYCVHLIVILAIACIFTFVHFLTGRKIKRGSNL